MRVVWISLVAVMSVVAGWQAISFAQATPECRSAPTYTAAQAALGQAAYRASCASCHGDNLDDGALGPPLKGVQFIQKYGGKSVEPLYTVSATKMPTSAPGSLPPPVYAQIVAYILQQNAIVAGTQELPADPARLAEHDDSAGRLQLHGVLALYAAGAEGDAPQSARSLHAGHRRDARGARAAGLARLAPHLRRAWLQPAEADHQEQRREPARRVELDAAARVQRRRAARARRRDVRARHGRPGAGARRAAPATCSGSIAASCRRASRRRSSAAWRCTAIGSTSARRTCTSSRSTRRPASWSGTRASATRGCAKASPAARSRRAARSWSAPRAPASAPSPAARRSSGSTPRPATSRGASTPSRSPAQPGGDSWNGIPLEQRSGASVWTPGSYDPATGLAFFGTGNTYDTGPLLQPSSQPGVTNDALYTNSTLAINPDTGKLVWHFQHHPQRSVGSRLGVRAADRRAAGQRRDAQLVVTAGKIGIYDAVDAATGASCSRSISACTTSSPRSTPRPARRRSTPAGFRTTAA